MLQSQESYVARIYHYLIPNIAMQQCTSYVALHPYPLHTATPTNPKQYLNPGCSVAHLHKLDHQVHGSTKASVKRRAMTRLRLVHSRRSSIADLDPRGISPPLKVGSKLKCSELISTTTR